MTEIRRVIIHTDGSVFPNPGEGGWAAILQYKGKTRCISGYLPVATNNVSEAEAVIKALELLKLPCVVDLYTDSMYVIRGIRALQCGRLLKTNQDRWKRLAPLMRTHQVHAIHVQGHNGNSLNELADSLASKAREKKAGEDFCLDDAPKTKKEAKQMLAAVA
jgi:ribonuclease HI